MPSLIRRWLHRFVPSHFHDPVGLTRRLLRSGDPAAVFAIESALLGLAAAPLDILLQIQEQKLYRKATAPRLPLLFVCGAARTGTTLVEQVLIRFLPVAFLNNLTAVFPRAPLTANRIFRPGHAGGGAAYHSYYGKTVGFSAPNDGLHVWDRWLGKDRTRIRTSLTPKEQDDMRRFFGAMEQLLGKPILTKNNSLSACANLVAEVFDQAFFICMTRDPLYLAQSQLQARLDIHGREDIPYGLPRPDERGPAGSDVIEHVCRQILFHERMIREQQRLVGPERFWIVQYEAFCQNPSDLVRKVAEEALRQPCPAEAMQLPPFEASTRVRIEPERFRQIADTMARLARQP